MTSISPPPPPAPSQAHCMGRTVLIYLHVSLLLIENVTVMGKRRPVLHRVVVYCAASLSRLRLHVACLYLHCGISHRADT